MKKKFGLLLAGILATSLVAQPGPGGPPPLPLPGGTSAPVSVPVETPAAAPAPSTPPPAVPSDISAPAPANTSTNKPAKKTAKKKSEKAAKKSTADKKAAAKSDKKELTPSAAPLALNQPAVASQKNVNVRGQANINSEVVAHLKQGDAVTVLEEITLKHPKTDEPAKWAKVALPAGTHVWVNSSFLDANKTVKPAKLNVRTGPGENYSVAGLLHKGDAVKEVSTKGEWTEIEAPANAYAYVAAHLLAPKPPGGPELAAANPPPAAPPTPAEIASSPTIAPPPVEQPVVPPPTAPPVEQPVVTAPVATPPPAPVVEETPVKRTVQREGVVTGTVSIQAPTYYQLKSLDNGNVIDYLFSDSTNVVLKTFRGKKVLISGEEGLDERWPNTPVLSIESIQVVH
jgi:SH3-like domain-containing protein